MKHNTNPVDGKPLKQSDLITLNFAQNDDGEYVDPVTFKVLTDNTHIVAVRHEGSANVFAYDTIERLNIKTKMWKDLLSDEDFSRKDVMTLQDPQNLESRDITAFKYIQDQSDTGVQKQEANINTSALGSSARILKAKEAVAKARAERGSVSQTPSAKSANSSNTMVSTSASINSTSKTKPTVPFNASNRTSGLAAASLTSTGFTPHTSADRALLSEEEYLLKPRRIKSKAFVQLLTNLSPNPLILELNPEHAPKAVYNFIRLSKTGFYNNITFHRSIRNFMAQTGDETGTGRGGKSIWNKPFEDELEGPLRHDSRGVISMANKGKNTNTSQFFILYQPAPHLDRKHTVFGRVVEGLETLDLLEEVEVDGSDRPLRRVTIVEAKVLIDPFDEFLSNKKSEQGNSGGTAAQGKRQNGKADGEDKIEDSKTTWTGKRLRADGRGVEEDDAADAGGVGKYLRLAKDTSEGNRSASTPFTDDAPEESFVRKKIKSGGRGGGFGNFESW